MRRMWPTVAVAVVLLMLATSILLIEAGKRRQTDAAYSRITIGMSKDDLRVALGGEPRLSQRERGKVLGPDKWTTSLAYGDHTGLAPKFRDLIVEQWDLPRAVLCVVSDPSGKVLCRRRLERPYWGQTQLRYALRWFGL